MPTKFIQDRFKTVSSLKVKKGFDFTVILKDYWDKKISKTWDLYQSILYTSVYYFLKKTKIFNPGFFFYRPISSFTL